MDTWAALDHQLQYKKQLGENTALIVEELRRCANELASTDVSMQTIRDMIMEANGVENSSGGGHA
jgi:putative GTP pyrophosphokinase